MRRPRATPEARLARPRPGAPRAAIASRPRARRAASGGGTVPSTDRRTRGVRGIGTRSVRADRPAGAASVFAGRRHKSAAASGWAQQRRPIRSRHRARGGRAARGNAPGNRLLGSRAATAGAGSAARGRRARPSGATSSPRVAEGPDAPDHSSPPASATRCSLSRGEPCSRPRTVGGSPSARPRACCSGDCAAVSQPAAGRPRWRGAGAPSHCADAGRTVARPCASSLWRRGRRAGGLGAKARRRPAPSSRFWKRKQKACPRSEKFKARWARRGTSANRAVAHAPDGHRARASARPARQFKTSCAGTDAAATRARVASPTPSA